MGLEVANFLQFIEKPAGSTRFLDVDFDRFGLELARDEAGKTTKEEAFFKWWGQ